MTYSPIWVSDNDNAEPIVPYGNPSRRFNALYVYDGKLTIIQGGDRYYSLYDAYNGELFLRVDGNPFYLFYKEYDVKTWNGDYSVLSPEGQARAGYVSPETLASQAATVTNSINRLKSKVKKPVITSEETEPLIEEEPKP